MHPWLCVLGILIQQAEAKAHKVGQKATEQALAAQAKADQAKNQQRRMRAQS
jgi:hypothetical protein